MQQQLFSTQAHKKLDIRHVSSCACIIRWENSSQFCTDYKIFLTHTNNTTKKIYILYKNNNTVYKSMQGKQKVCIHAQKKHPIKKRFLHSFTANADQMKQNRTMHSQATEIIQIRSAQAKDITDRLQIRVESLTPKGSAQKLKQRSMTHPQQAKRLKSNSHT